MIHMLVLNLAVFIYAIMCLCFLFTVIFFTIFDFFMGRY